MTSTSTAETGVRGDSGASGVADCLDVSVAAAFDLRSQIKQAHWNLVGAGFIGLHGLFDEHAQAVGTQLDEFAERLHALGGVPAGTARQAAQRSILPDLEARELPWREAASMLAERYEQYSRHLRESAEACGRENDLATQDLYLEAIRAIEKGAWMLRAHLAEPGEAALPEGGRAAA